LRQDLEIIQLRFKLLLNTETVFTPLVDNPKFNLQLIVDSSFLLNNHQIKILRQQQKIALANTQVERSKLLPDLSIGYNNQSIQGNGSDNVFYPKSYRFHSVQFGIGVPIFYGSQKSKINSAKVNELISDNNYQIGLQILNLEYQTAYLQYQRQLKTVTYLEETALKNANTITITANKQFENGDINYLEWSMLINNAITIQSSYVDAVKDLNQTAIQINYLTTK
jgi:cobalt-zinc-cadmium resistance protein CzcA